MGINTDHHLGSPRETEEDFEQTLSLYREADSTTRSSSVTEAQGHARQNMRIIA